MGVLVGVLALQGDFAAHSAILAGLGASVREVRTPADLNGLHALVLPGGESTTMTLGIAREGLGEPLRDLIASGIPVLATCAGLILLDGTHLAVMDMQARRNAFGRQVRSFEADVTLDGFESGPIRAAFIRAPWVESHGPSVRALAEVDGRVIAVRDGDILAVAFHPEITGESCLHGWLLERACVRA